MYKAKGFDSSALLLEHGANVNTTWWEEYDDPKAMDITSNRTVLSMLTAGFYQQLTLLLMA
jgi:hypothetical protein